jgi:polyphosphate kinase 2 (PPK2 family)
LVKFWLHIDADTQLKRFQERQEDPEKQWKITAEDWRNREKWPQYQEAVEEMLMYTDTAKAPWHIIAGNDKRYARIEALRLVYQTVQEKLKREMRP